MIVSKTISNHKAVQECLDGEEQNFDYKYDVFLKDGWLFSDGHMEGCQSGRFDTVKDFFEAKPIKKKH